MSDRSRWFVTSEWLAEHLGDPQIAIVDASWHLPTAGRSGASEFLQRHIPGAVHFDIDAIADKSSSLPHMLPSAPVFAKEVGALGIGDGMKIVVYDSAGLFSAPRVWWSFRVMGAPDVVILEGGLPQWIAESRPVESGPVTRPPATFTPHFNPAMVSDVESVRAHVANRSAHIVDARPAARFSGEAPEPRPGIPSGHIPGSFNLPAGQILGDGRLKSDADLAAAFGLAGIDLTRPVVTSCGSGVMAATIGLAAEILGAEKVALYDGAWTEWAGSGQNPIARSAPPPTDRREP